MSGLDHFDLLAPFYERFIRPRPPLELQALLAMPAGATLLDVGGGTGRLTQFFAPANPVIVADLSLPMLRQAAQKPALRALMSPAEALPFADASIPAIVIIDALHHVHDQAQTCAELYRVLAPGGTLVVEEPDLRTFTVKLLALAEKLLLMRSHFLAPSQIAALFPADAQINITQDGFNAWIAVRRPAVRRPAVRRPAQP